MKNMNKYIGLACLLLLAVHSLSAQQGPGESPAAGSYYHVISDGESDNGALLLKEMELRFAVYNRIFRFDPTALNAPLRVRAFQDKAAYDRYVSSLLGKTVDGAVYIHYTGADRRELVIHRPSGAGETALPYQAFVQYLRAFIPYPPPWIQEGFGVYFNTLRFDPASAELEFEENLAWLDAAKASGAPSLESILLASSGSANAVQAPGQKANSFQGAAWALVSFFMNTNNEGYFRTLTELFMALSPAASAGENAEAVFRRVTLWNDINTLQEDYKSYLGSRKSFAVLVREGQGAYAAKRADEAENRFLSAKELKPAHYLPYYYLGLLSYEKKDYAIAEDYYRSAGENGADKGLISYALGLNAAAWGRAAEAVSYLEAAAAANPQRYRTRTADFIKRLN